MSRKTFRSLVAVLVRSLVLLSLAGCDNSGSNDGDHTDAAKQTELAALTPEEFARSAVTMLIENDAEGFINFAFPSKEKILAVIDASALEDGKEQAKEEIDTEYDEQKAKVLASFGEVRKEAKTEGCDWKSARFVSAEYDIKTRHGLTHTDIKVNISAAGKTSEIKLDDCMLINDRWYAMDEMGFRG